MIYLIDSTQLTKPTYGMCLFWRLQWEKTLSINAAVHQERLLWQKQQQGMRSTWVVENERLKGRVQQLTRENYELTRQLKNERIRNRDEDAAVRREMRHVTTKARLEARAAHRLRVRESVAVQDAQVQIKQMEQVGNVLIAASFA